MEPHIVAHPQKPPIRYEDFVKMDIRIGTIQEAEEVPETDKLLKCTVNFGPLGMRTIVSGIREFRNPESIIGLQVPYIINLEPRVIKGIESQGMLLAISFEAETPSAGFAFLHPDTTIPPGTAIR
jgi:methionyl-tRNA synthetase